MTRQYSAGRTLSSKSRDRARVAALVARRPSTAVVTRLTGDGVTGPKALTTVATFTCRLDTARASAPGVKDAYVSVALVTQLTALRANDQADYSGRPVDLRRDDRLAITDEEGVTTQYVAGAVQLFRAHIEVDVDARG